MLVDNRKVFIFWKDGGSAYANVNKEVVPKDPILIGSSVSSVNKILANPNEQAKLMPQIIGISPTSQDWNKMLNNYWNSIRVEIPAGGKELEVGFIYDINDSSIASNIKSINDGISNEKAKLTKDEDLKKYIDDRIDAINKDFESKMTAASKLSNERDRETKEAELYRIKWNSLALVEGERYKVGSPITIEDYILYRYVMGYRDVANEFALVSKSNNIRFYLHSEVDIKKYKQDKLNVERSKMELFVKVGSDLSLVTDVLYAMGYGSELPTDNVDKLLMLKEKMETDTNKFISVANNKQLQLIGTIERYVAKDILYRLPGSQIVTDGIEHTKVLGNSLEEVILYFMDKENKATISEYESRFKGLPQ